VEIQLGFTDAIVRALASNPLSEAAVPQIIGDVVNQRKRQGKYGSLYYQDNDDLVYMPVQVEVGHDNIPGTSSTYAEALGITDDQGNYTGKWWLPNPVMATELRVHVVDTELTERNGVVSELINISGFRVKITGFLVNTDANEFPEDDYDTLVRLSNLGHPFKIHSVKTDILFADMGNADKLVTVRSLQFGRRPGVKHVQDYELELVSEMPFSLIDIS
jgi:Domain of unknown function (DUF6046)